MTDRDKFQATFSHLHASAGTLTEVMKMTNEKKTVRRYTKPLVAAAAAVVLVLALGATAYAANFLGIRELLPASAKQLELPETTVEKIVRHDETAATEGWSARVTESLSDAYTALVTVTVTAEEKYILASDAIPEDPVSVIGLDGEETLADYAATRGKTLLFLGGHLDLPEDIGDISGGTSWQNISDNELAFLFRVEKHISVPSFDAVCRVWATEYGAKETAQRVEIPLTLTELPSEAVYELTPSAPDAVPGLRLGNATVTETPLGIYMTFPVDADNLETIYDFGFAACDEVPGWQGHFTWDDGIWFSKWTMGQGTVGDTLTLHFYGQHDEAIGDVVFTK